MDIQVNLDVGLGQGLQNLKTREGPCHNFPKSESPDQGNVFHQYLDPHEQPLYGKKEMREGAPRSCILG